MKTEPDISHSPRSQLFTVRVWREDVAESRHEWRGKVQYVSSGEAFYFRQWAELVERLEAWLEQEDQVNPARD